MSMSSMTHLLGGNSSNDEREDVTKNLLMAYGSDEANEGQAVERKKKKDKKKKKEKKNKDKDKDKDKDKEKDREEKEKVSEAEADNSNSNLLQIPVTTPNNSASSFEDFIPSQNNLNNISLIEKGKKKKEKEFGLPDAKSLLSNERNFLSWIGTSFSLGAIGTAIITFFGTDTISLISGILLWAIALGFIMYSTMQFRRRADAIRTRSRGPFDDQRGPLALVVLTSLAIGIFLLFFVIVRPSANVSFGKNGSSSTTTTTTT